MSDKVNRSNAEQAEIDADVKVYDWNGWEGSKIESARRLNMAIIGVNLTPRELRMLQGTEQTQTLAIADMTVRDVRVLKTKLVQHSIALDEMRESVDNMIRLLDI